MPIMWPAFCAQGVCGKLYAGLNFVGNKPLMTHND